MTERRRGTIKFVNLEKGFGFVATGEKTGQYYFRLTSVTPPSSPGIEHIGTSVEFSLKPDPKHEGKQIAVNLVMTSKEGNSEVRKLLSEFFAQKIKERTLPALDVNKTYLGRITRVNPEGGFGFIRLHVGGTLFFHVSALEVSLNDDGKPAGTGVQVKPGPSRKNPNEFEAAEVVIVDSEGDKAVLESVQALIASKRRRDLSSYEKREATYQEREQREAKLDPTARRRRSEATL